MNRLVALPAPDLLLDELFDLLVDLPPHQREAELLRRCSDPVLRDEVRGLLRAADGNPPPPRLPPATGRLVGHYRLGTCLGSGASGSVWTAFDERLQAWTALKLFHDTTPGSGLQGVMREARAASAIISDHVVRIKSVGRDGDHGPLFIEMLLCAEYEAGPQGERLVVGRSLAEDPPTDPREAVRLVVEACRGVEAAHRIGVLHRDLKPANLLVMPVSRRTLVADFGLSSPELRPTLTEELLPTETVSFAWKAGEAPIVGTPCFLALEAARGAPPTRQVDVYGLGATLYTLLGGRPPYLEPGERVDARTVVDRVRAGPPTALPRIAPHLDGRLVAVVERAMDRDPSRRYPTAAALAEDLVAWLGHHPTSLDAPHRLLRAALFVRRHQAPVLGGLVLGGALLAFASLNIWLAQVKSELEADVAALELRREEAARLAADAWDRAELAEAGAKEAGQRAEAARSEADLANREAAAAQRAKEQANHLATKVKSESEQQVAAARKSEAEALARAEKEAAERKRAEQQRKEAEAEATKARAGWDKAKADLKKAESAVKFERAEKLRAQEQLAEARKRASNAERAFTLAESRLAEANDHIRSLEAKLISLAGP